MNPNGQRYELTERGRRAGRRRERFAVTLDTSGAAFDGFYDGEDAPQVLGTLLREIAARIEAGATSWTVLDVNGNAIGRAEWSR